MPIRFAIDRCLLGVEGFLLGLFFLIIVHNSVRANFYF